MPNNKIYFITITFKPDDIDGPNGIPRWTTRRDQEEFSYSGTAEAIWFLWFHMVRNQDDIARCIVMDSTGLEYDPSLGCPLQIRRNVNENG